MQLIFNYFFYYLCYMKNYTATRLSSGNKLFPSKITLMDNSIVIKRPSLFSSKERTIPFSRVSSVSYESPFIGFSSIIIETNGESSEVVHGFYKSEVLEIRDLILSKI